MKALVKHFKHFHISQGVLYTVTALAYTENVQLVPPTPGRVATLFGLHNGIRHFCRDRTLSLLKERSYWPGINTKFQIRIHSCERFVKWNTPTNQRVSLVSIRTCYHLDFRALEPSDGGQQYTLIIIDNFTRYVQAWANKFIPAKPPQTTLWNIKVNNDETKVITFTSNTNDYKQTINI